MLSHQADDMGDDKKPDRRTTNEEIGMTGTSHSGTDVAIGEMDNHFNIWSTLGVMYTINCVPIVIGYSLAVVIGVGGGPFFIYGYIVTLVFQGVLCACLAELASAFPHMSGQVHWTTSLLPNAFGECLAYYAGFFAMAGWFFWNVGTAILVSRMAFSTVLMCHPDFDLHPYHIYLGYVLCLLLAQLMNTYGFSLYRHMMNTMVIFINAITLIIMVSLLVQASPKQSAETVFVTVINETGWSSTGLVFLLSLLPGITALNGLDSAAHLTEEIQNPGVHIPQVMMGSFLLGGIIAIPMAIIYMLCATNWGNLLNPIAGSSFTQLIFDGVNNTPLAVFITVMLCVISTVATGTLTVTFSRILNSFARQRFFAFSPWMARISTRTNTPNNAVTVCTLSSIIAGLLMLGNSTALNAFLGSAAVCFFCSYMIPISCLLYRGRSALPETYYFRLGRLGRVFGWVSLVWMTLMSVMLCFPQYVPVTAATMNYTAPVVIGLFLIAALNWHLYARNYMVFSSTSS